MKEKFKSGYSLDKAKEYVDISKKFLLVTDFEKVYKYDSLNKKYTEDLSHYSAYFSQENLLEPFKVKFRNDDVLKIPQFENVSFKSLEACSINGRIFFRAESLEVLKK